MRSLDDWIVVRGAGDLATGTIHALVCAGWPVVALESAHPSSIRREVSFSEAVYDGQKCVEGVTAVLAKDAAEAFRLAEEGIYRRCMARYPHEVRRDPEALVCRGSHDLYRSESCDQYL